MSDQDRKRTLEMCIKTIQQRSENPQIKKMIGIINGGSSDKEKLKKLARTYFEEQARKK